MTLSQDVRRPRQAFSRPRLSEGGALQVDYTRATRPVAVLESRCFELKKGRCCDGEVVQTVGGSSQLFSHLVVGAICHTRFCFILMHIQIFVGREQFPSLFAHPPPHSLSPFSLM